jgi:hypothetical protein
VASSSSSSSIISIESESTREVTLEFDPIAAYEAYAPLHWDAEEWDFHVWSEDDEPLTDGEDLQFLFNGELEDEDGDDDMSWEGDFSTSEEEIDDASIENDSAAGGFSGDNGGDDSSSDIDSGDDDSDIGAAPPIKRRKVLGTYWW